MMEVVATLTADGVSNSAVSLLQDVPEYGLEVYVHFFVQLNPPPLSLYFM
jgi:hypothetical protein